MPSTSGLCLKDYLACVEVRGQPAGIIPPPTTWAPETQLMSSGLMASALVRPSTEV